MLGDIDLKDVVIAIVVFFLGVLAVLVFLTREDGTAQDEENRTDGRSGDA